MRIGEILYFSPKFRFWDLDWDNPKKIIEAFQDRVVGYYLFPARKLCEQKDAFACGVLCVTAIDFIARIQLGDANSGGRIQRWLSTEIKEFNQNCPHCGASLAYLFYTNFRNGLVHEGRIKKLGQFIIGSDQIIAVNEEVILVNPEILLKRIEESFYKYLKGLNTDQTALARFIANLRSDFGDEVLIAKST